MYDNNWSNFLDMERGMFLQSQLFYDLTEDWKNNVIGEPSDMYLFSTCFRGAIIAVLGLASIIAYFYCK